MANLKPPKMEFRTAGDTGNQAVENDSGFHHMVLATAIETCQVLSSEMIGMVMTTADAMIKQAIREHESLSKNISDSDILVELGRISSGRQILAKAFVSDLHRHLATVAYKPTTETNITRKRIALGLGLESSSSELPTVMEKTEFATAKLAQFIDLNCQDRLDELAGYVSTLRGIKGDASRLANVFKGDLFSTALRKAITSIEVSDDVAAIWIHAATEPMASGVNDIYQELIEQIANTGVEKRTSKATGAQTTVNDLLGGLLNRVIDPVLKYGFDLGTIENEAQVQKQLDRAASGVQMLTPDEYKALLGVIAPDSSGPTRIGDAIERAFPGIKISGQIRDTIKAMGKVSKPARLEDDGNAGRMAVRVMHLLMNRITQDPRVLPSIRTELRRITPKFEAIAKKDASVVTNPSHPVRVFVETLVRHSMTFNDEEEMGYALFLLPIQSEIRQYADSSSEPFKGLLDLQVRLEQHWANSELLTARPTGNAEKIVAWAEQRNTQAYYVRREVQEQYEQICRIPAFVRRFIIGPWVNVMATIELNGSAFGVDLRMAHQILKGLIYTSDKRWMFANRAKAVSMLPNIVTATRAACRVIEWDDKCPEAVEFFMNLSLLHQQLLNESLVFIQTYRSDKQAALQMLNQTSFEPVESETQIGKSIQSTLFVDRDEDLELWLTPSEAAAIGNIHPDDNPYQHQDIQMSGNMNNNKFEADQQAVEYGGIEDIRNLKVGSWLEVEKAGIHHRASLHWTNASEGREPNQFMLVLKGGEAVTMTARQMERLMAQGRMRIILTGNIMSEAMVDVLQEPEVAVV